MQTLVSTVLADSPLSADQVCDLNLRSFFQEQIVQVALNDPDACDRVRELGPVAGAEILRDFFETAYWENITEGAALALVAVASAQVNWLGVAHRVLASARH